MADDQPDILAIFTECLAHDSDEERAKYLDEACQDDPKARGRIEALLRAHVGAGNFLGGASPGIAPTLDIAPVSERPGALIGRYKLLQEIGEGGFGVVFMAQQLEPIKRKVAVKIVKPGMDTREVIARFEAERQALAMMDHPNIARVLDAGATESGRPYFAMELVRGIPITDFCDKNNLTPHERLNLFVRVCLAVQHAHQKGIIHRDIKPSNVLVTLDDAGPEVKVIDFGVAKAIGQELTEKTLFTRFEQMIGTPLYMSPEQTEMRTRDIDTRSDIYSLGVLLYELLTGATPFERERLREAAYDEICRIIREEEPPKPSVRISTLGETLATVSEHRRTEPKRLSTLFKGDIDWIVMRALEKDRNRRYDTAKDLASDVQRHLDHEPIVARPPSTLYRLRKFTRRNKGLVVAGSIVAATLVIATVTGFVLAGWAVRNAREADRQRETAEKNLEIAIAARQQAQDAITGRASQFLRDGQYEEAEALYRDMVRIRRENLGGAHASTLDAVFSLVSAQKSLGRYEDAIAALERALSDQRQAPSEDASAIDKTRDELANLRWRRSLQLSENPDLTAEELRRAMELAVQAQQRHPDCFNANLAVAWAEYRAGTAAIDSERMATLRTLIAWQPEWAVLCALHAMVAWQNGEEELARLWHQAMCCYFAKATARWPEPNAEREASEERVSSLVRQCAELAGLSDPTSEPPPPTGELISSFTELIERYPEVSWLSHTRGSLYGRLGEWDRAAADYEAAVKVDPEGFRHWEGWLAVMLFLDDREACLDIVADAMQQFDSYSTLARWDILRLLWLCPETGADWAEIYEEAERCLKEKPDAAWRMVRVADAAYRCGDFDRVLEVLELAVATNESKGRRYDVEEVTIPAHRAMALHELGQIDEARRSLEEARAIFREKMSPLDGEYVVHQDRPVKWCWLQVLLRRAGQLVDPDGTVNTSGSGGRPIAEVDASPVDPGALPR